MQTVKLKKGFLQLLIKSSIIGKDLYQLLEDCFLEHGLEFKNIIGKSFDGASNMCGQFSELQSYIKSQNKNSVYFSVIVTF